MRWMLLVAILISSHMGCQSASPSDDDAMHWRRTELYFGQTRRDGSKISDRQWKAFVDEQIVPKFPSGLTVLDADGRWRDANGVIHTEASRVLIVLYPHTDTVAPKHLNEIARAYCSRFDQEAVMRLDSDEELRFIEPEPPHP